MSSRSLDDLCPELRELALEFVERCAERGVDVTIYCTYRTNEEQEKEYAKGRTAPGKISTYKKAGESKHNCVDEDGNPAARAYDAVAVKGGQAIWSAAAPEWEIMGSIATELGLNCGMYWKMKDSPHFELRN